MKVSLVPEPELEFELGRHVDIRHGLAELFPLDRDGVRQVRVAVIGSAQTRDAVVAWLERTALGVDAKSGRLGNLFPAFPGFSASSPFAAEAQYDDRLSVELGARLIQTAIASPDPARSAAELVAGELADSLTKGRPAVVIVALPPDLLAVTDELANPTPETDPTGMSSEDVDGSEEVGGSVQRTDLRDYLKAIALPTGVPLQLLRPTTYGLKGALRRSHGDARGSLQDEATRAWNFYVALYYKASGTPWRLPRQASDLATCYVGVSFFKSPDATTLQTAMAQVFNERGQGVVIRGGPARQRKEDRVPHLEAADARSLLATALASYRVEHRTMPARIVVHKSSRFDSGETQGIMEAATDADIEVLDLVAIADSPIRLMRVGAYPVVRGTLLDLGPSESLLYTRGSVPYFSTYPGQYVPRPLRLRLDSTSTPPEALASEVLALTKMNWNNTQFDGAIPITLRASREVGRVLRYLPPEAPMQNSYAFYM